MVPNLWPETKYGDTTEPRAHQFVYEFDFADRWTHLCTAATRIDPAANWESFRAVRCRVGGETIPDQDGRRWADDDEEHDEPPNPGSDLSPLQPMVGPPITGLSGRVAGSRALLVCVRCEVVDTGESTARVVPGFDPFEDRL